MNNIISFYKKANTITTLEIAEMLGIKHYKVQKRENKGVAEMKTPIDPTVQYEQLNVLMVQAC